MKILYYILNILLVFALTACSDQDLNDFIADNILYHLNTSAEDVSAEPIDQFHKISVNTNTDWTAETEASWIVIDNAAGDSKTELSFKTLANDTPNERVGKIGIYCFGKHKKDITIRQGKVSFSINKETLTYSSVSSGQTITLSTEGTWTIISSPEWVKISETEGVSNSQVTVCVDELMSGKDRTGTIVIYDQSYREHKMTIFQKGKYLIADLSYLSFLASGENIENVNIETDGVLECACDPWVICDISDNNRIGVCAKENVSGKTKNGTIYISMKDVVDFIPVTVNIHQAPVRTNASLVDLGLSVKWASYNIGANNEDEIGGHYQFGTGPDYSYHWLDTPNLPSSVTGTMYDTSHAYWGGHWRNPTMGEWYELIGKCSMERIELQETQYIEPYNEMSGKSDKRAITQAYKFTAPNGNSIIVPIAGTWYYYDPVYGDSFHSVCGIELWIIAQYLTNQSQPLQIWLDDSYKVGSMSWNHTYCSVRAVWDE